MANRVNRQKKKRKKSLLLNKNMCNTSNIFDESKEQYKGVHGFKNGAVAHTSGNWAEVDLFLHTWDFLPNDISILESLSKEQLVELCISSLSACCRMDFEGKGIKFIQEKMHKYRISPDAKLNNLK